MLLPIKLKSKVVYGKQIGGKIGFPTANLDPNNLFKALGDNFIKLKNSQEILEAGIYACQVIYQNQIFLAAGYIGPNQTFEKNAFKIEIHILDFQQNLYNQELTVVFLKKIRDDKKFSSLDEIKLQIKLDCQKIRNFFHTP